MSQYDDPQAELCHRACDGNLVRMKLAIRSGADLNAMYDGWPPVHWAIFGGRYFAAKFLLRLGADFECKDEDGRTPLLSVIDEAWGWSELFVKDLIRLGADLNHVDNNGDTAIQLAVYRSLNDAVDNLLKNGSEDHRATPCSAQRDWDAYYDGMRDVDAVKNLIQLAKNQTKTDE